jgi:hypothetical protein
VNVSVVVPPSEMLGAPKALLINGGDSTVRVADAVLPVPPSFEVTLPVVLVKEPALTAVTLTAKLHVPLDGRVPPLRLTDEPAAVAVIVPLPQLPVWPEGLATTSPAGKVSVKATPDRLCAEFGLVKVNAKIAVPFSGSVEMGTVAVPPPEAASPVFASV